MSGKLIRYRVGKHNELDAPICTSLYTSVLLDIHSSFSTNVHKDDDAYIIRTQYIIQ